MTDVVTTAPQPSAPAEEKLQVPAPKEEGLVTKTKQVVVDHWKLILAVLVVLVVLFFFLSAPEKFTSEVNDFLAKYNPLKLLKKK